MNPRRRFLHLIDFMDALSHAEGSRGLAELMSRTAVPLDAGESSGKLPLLS
jgi:hypothetical protein